MLTVSLKKVFIMFEYERLDAHNLYIPVRDARRNGLLLASRLFDEVGLIRFVESPLNPSASKLINMSKYSKRFTVCFPCF